MISSLSYRNLYTGIFILLCFSATAQQQDNILPDASDASDPAVMKSCATLDIESYFYYQPVQFYAVRAGYRYGLQNGKHLFGLSIPFVHSVYNDDFRGYENTTGIGDIRMLYMGGFKTKQVTGVSRVSPYLEITAPTGEYMLGRGAGSWLFKPGMIFTYTVDPTIAFYPEVRFQFSGGKANTQAGNSGLPDPEDPEKDDNFQNLTLELPVVVQLEAANAWCALDINYTQSFVQKEYFIYFRTDFGAMIGERTSAAVTLSKFIAGQPRLNVIVQAKFQFFIGR